METGGPDPDIRPGGSDAPPEDGSDGRAPPAKRRRRDNSRMTVPIRRSDCCSDDEGGGRPEEDGVGQIPGGDLPDETGAGDIRDLLADDAGADGKRGGLWKTLDLYWTDAAERKGAVYLYGLVRAPADEDGGPAYQSCCVEVTNNQRSLLVLPRMRLGKVAGAAERRFLFDLYGEIKRLLTPSIVPEAEGFTADLVTRPYAFGDPGVPREPTRYLRVRYDAKYPPPDREVCSGGGATFERILGSGASATENLLLDRDIMGPGWIRLYYVRPAEGGRRMSWCRWECRVGGPEMIKKLETILPESVPPPPPISTVTLALKTVLNPRSHRREIAVVSAIRHDRVMLESASDESTRNMSQITLVRPVDFGGSDAAAARFPRDMDEECRRRFGGIVRCRDERALLSGLLARIGAWDPDVVVSHDGWGRDVDVLLDRCADLGVRAWSMIGRRRDPRLPGPAAFGDSGEGAVGGALEGRLLCDTKVLSKDLLKNQTSYELAELTRTQLRTERLEIDEADVPLWCGSGGHFVDLAKHTLNDAQLVQRLMFKLQLLPLTKQLTNIAGNLWNSTIKGNRSQRAEYILLHEFHKMGYLLPEKLTASQRREEAGCSGGKKGYAGAEVFEPSKGLHESFVLVMDYESLSAALIQEYNLCFTTMDWTDKNNGDQEHSLPALPAESQDRGVLPKVVEALVVQRRNLKELMKSEVDSDKKEQLNIRQLALKITACSVYGCLGYDSFRFYAEPIAALLAQLGRQTLVRTKDIAENTMGLEVIYGDTDSIMINTRISRLMDYSKVKELGDSVKSEVNKLYKKLELEVDAIFRSMLILEKKKYAALTISEGPGGLLKFGKELKGLDLVRRDWCIQSRESGKYVVDQILSSEERDVVFQNIHDHLELLSEKMRYGELSIGNYVITKGLNKHPNEYKSSLPHVQVARRMLKNHKAVGIGDHIPYIITESNKIVEKSDNVTATKMSKNLSERAYHPDEVERSERKLRPDIDWYWNNQIIPPILRLCKPLGGVLPEILDKNPGLDSFNLYSSVSGTITKTEHIIKCAPEKHLSRMERFRDVDKFTVLCSSCKTESEFPGAFRLVTVNSGSDTIFCQSGFSCPNPMCPSPDNWGEADLFSCACKILNLVRKVKQDAQRKYYDGLARCDNPLCDLETRLVFSSTQCCPRATCDGSLKAIHNESWLQTQLKYLDSLFDIAHAKKRMLSSCPSLTEGRIGDILSKDDKDALALMRGFLCHSLNKSGYNWVSSEFFQTLFGECQTVG